MCDQIPKEVIDEMSKHCNCCIQCQNVPCDGVLSCGFCDDHCVCDNEYYDHEDEL